MKTHLFGLIGVVIVAAALSACKEDPTGSLAGSPDSIFVSLNPIFLLDERDTTKGVIAGVLDHSLSPLPERVTASTAAPTVATVVPDTSTPDPTGTHWFFTVTSKQLGATTVTFSGAGLTTTAPVNVLPAAYRGAASSRTPKGGDTLTLHATTLLKLDPGTAQFNFPGRTHGIVLAVSAESLRVLMPYLGSNFGVDSISGVVATYVPGLSSFARPIEPNIVQTGDFWAGDSSWQTAPDITPNLPAALDSVKMLVGIASQTAFDTLTNNRNICPEFVTAHRHHRSGAVPSLLDGTLSTGPCMIFKFTLTAPTTLNFTTVWASGNAGGTNPDIDIYACSDSTVANFGTACFEDGGAGATTARLDPVSTGNHTYPTGTHWFVIEYVFACNEGLPLSGVRACDNNGQQANYYVTIAQP